MQSALIPSRNALVSVDLLSHPDSDVRVSVVSCLTEIVRITAPETPYSDDLMKVISNFTNTVFNVICLSLFTLSVGSYFFGITGDLQVDNRSFREIS